MQFWIECLTHGSESSLATTKIFSNSRRHCSKFRLGMWKYDKSSFNLTWGWRSWKQCCIFTSISGPNCDTIEPPIQESLDVPEEKIFKCFIRKTLQNFEINKKILTFDIRFKNSRYSAYLVYYATIVMYLTVNQTPWWLRSWFNQLLKIFKA